MFQLNIPIHPLGVEVIYINSINISVEVYLLCLEDYFLQLYIYTNI